MKKQLISALCALLALLLLLPALPAVFAAGNAGDARLTTDKTEYREGEAIMVTATGEGSDWVGIVRKGEKPGNGTDSIRWYYVVDSQYGNESGKPKDIRTAERTNEKRADLFDLPAGDYTIFLLANDGYDVIASVDIKVTPAGTASGKTLSTDKTVYEEDEPIMVTATGEGKDWVGIFLKGEKLGSAQSIRWYYVVDPEHGNESGKAKDIRTAEKVGDQRTDLADLPAGAYTVYLVADDGVSMDDVIASVDITVGARLATDKTVYEEGEPIMVTAIGSGSDWVGIYCKGETPAADGIQSIRWYNVVDESNPKDIRTAGPNDSRADLADLPAGDYTIYLLANGGYEVIASVDITVESHRTEREDLFGYVQTKPSKAPGKIDLRVLAEMPVEVLTAFDTVTLTVVFTKADGTEVTYTLDVTVAYRSVKALGETVSAREGYAFFGVVVTGIPTEVTEAAALVSFDGGEAVSLGKASLKTQN